MHKSMRGGAWSGISCTIGVLVATCWLPREQRTPEVSPSANFRSQPVPSTRTESRDSPRTLTANGTSGAAQKPAVTKWQAHDRTITFLIATEDGKHILSCSSDQTARLWDTATRKQLLELPVRGTDSCGAMTRDGRLLVITSHSGHALRIWNTATGELERSINGNLQGIRSLTFNSTGQLLASAGDDRIVKIWKVTDGLEDLTLVGHRGSVTAVAFSGGSRVVASGSADHTIKLWEHATGKEVATLIGHVGGVTSLAFSPDDTLLASAAWDETVRVWDVASGEELFRFNRQRSRLAKRVTYAYLPPPTVSFDSDGGRLACSGLRLPVTIWDVRSGLQKPSIRPDMGSATTALFVKGRPVRMVCGTTTGAIEMHEVGDK